MTGQEVMEALSTMSKSDLEKDAVVMTSNGWLRVGKVEMVKDDDEIMWPVIQTVGAPTTADD